MNASGIRWVVIVLIYAVFHFGYGGNGSPLTADEVDYYVQRAIDGMGPDSAETIREFASTGDGNEFFAVNLNKYREKPKYRDGRKVDGRCSPVPVLAAPVHRPLAGPDFRPDT